MFITVLSRPRSLLGFPVQVNEVAARLLAAGVALVAIGAVATGQLWLTVPLAYGFVARVLSGPRFSPWALVVTRLLVPRLGLPERLVPGPPKRFAQGIGAVLTVSAAVAAVAFGATSVPVVLLLIVAFAASLEASFAYCIGCRLFALLMRVGLVPQDVCEACADIRLRPITMA
jgi:hypothetical protein